MDARRKSPAGPRSDNSALGKPRLFFGSAASCAETSEIATSAIDDKSSVGVGIPRKETGAYAFLKRHHVDCVLCCIGRTKRKPCLVRNIFVEQIRDSLQSLNTCLSAAFR
jgi:hypothetical protein